MRFRTPGWPSSAACPDCVIRPPSGPGPTGSCPGDAPTAFAGVRVIANAPVELGAEPGQGQEALLVESYRPIQVVALAQPVKRAPKQIEERTAALFVGEESVEKLDSVAGIGSANKIAAEPSF